MEEGNVLIIGREVGQSVIIGDVIKVTVLKYGSKPRLAIDAPEEIQISRLRNHDESSNRFKKRSNIIGDIMQIGDDIKVTIIQTQSRLLRFAIDAPKEISIIREEIYATKNQSNFQQILTLVN